MCDFESRQLLRVLPCSHEFHAKCVDKWLKVRGEICFRCFQPEALGWIQSLVFVGRSELRFLFPSWFSAGEPNLSHLPCRSPARLSARPTPSRPIGAIFADPSSKYPEQLPSLASLFSPDEHPAASLLWNPPTDAPLFSGLFSDFREENCPPLLLASHPEWPLTHVDTEPCLSACLTSVSVFCELIGFVLDCR